METSLKDQIKKLVDLQKIDSDIYLLNKDLEEKPQLVEELKAEYESKKARLHELEEKEKEIQVKRKDDELELQAKEDDITKANAQLSEIKTNKEYTAKISEIENIKADKSQIEEKILISYDEMEGLTAEIDDEKKVLAEEEKKYLDKKKEVDNEVLQIKDRIKVLEGQRNQIVPNIDKDQVSLYEKILKHKEGQAIVPVQGSTCGGCYMNVTPQQINAIKMHEELVQCEMCNRILYIEEDLE